jgi:hypothetical protein
MPERIERILEQVLLFLIGVFLLASSAPRVGTTTLDRVSAFTRPVEFNFESWTSNAAWIKLSQSAMNLPGYTSRETRLQVVMEYQRVTAAILTAENRLQILYADPSITNKEATTAHIREQLQALQARQDQIAPLAESIVQEQVAVVLAENGLTLAGQPTPPVLYHVTPLPMNIIISPRDRIEEIASTSLEPNLPVDKQIQIEDDVARALDVSTLIVPVGGIGTYPSMVMQTDSFTWQVGTVIHEWTHNFLTLRPLGVLYGETPELRTMNETTASIVENELGPILLARFYPQLVSASPYPEAVSWTLGFPRFDDPPPFDFRAEMHTTRVRVDELLAEGKIDEAESYMEQRRQFFWDNGYAIRKLNQAYFAFYGAYADVPGGAAGEDPVGPAVRALREQSPTLAAFLNTISWMTSFEDLQAAVGESK